ncbi:MAG: molybdate ABC transporter substrate-binding protein [Chloroflexi bacterium]|nr:molybdate ABC transporter substrate-binding protein [Chloroflexota bacterium]
MSGPRAILVLALAAAAMASACGTRASSGTDERTEVTILAAASLQKPLERLREAYETAAPGVRLTVSTDSSAALRTQIEQGADADLFLSADAANPAALVAGGMTVGPAVPFAGNQLAVIVPRDNPAGIRSPVDLARPGVRIIGAGDSVPITTYALDVVGRLERLDGYPPGFAGSYAANVVSRETNVQSIVARLALGEGDAGIVYLTDAAGAAGRVREIPVPPAAQVTAVYAGAVLAATDRPEEATAFLRWLTGPDGQAILAELGFLPPP